MIKINGVDIVTPEKTFKVDISDIDGDSNRNAYGDLLRDRITTKRKLSCEWQPLKMSEVSTLLQAVAGLSFSVYYPDPMDGAYSTRTFYVGDRSAPAMCIDESGEMLWKGLSMNFIEM